MVNTYLEAFESKVERLTESGCWIWMGELSNMGYGRFRNKGKREGAHRFSYRFFNGPVGDLFVLHRCDVSACVNPSHLFLGTQADNMADKSRKGRCADRNNERHPMHKYSDDQIMEMRELYASGMLQREIADKFGTDQSHISRIVRNLSRKQEAIKAYVHSL